MDNLILIVDELAALHAFLPAIIKFSLIILICLLAYVPIALISWILSVAFGKALQKLIFFCEEVSERFFDLSKRCSARSKRLMTTFYSKYTTVISFDNPKYSLSGHPVQQSLDNFDSELKMAPAVASDNETKKADLVRQLTQSVDNLGGNIGKLNEIDIPELDLDKKHETRKRAALSSLILFVPLLVAVIIVNTALLREIFESLVDVEIEFFGVDIALAPFLALMFTLIELGVGVVFGFQERKKEKASSGANDFIIFAFGWFIIIGLATMEFVFYLMIGTGVEDFDELLDTLELGFIYAMLAGGILSVLGPCIVLALYIFGHRVSTAFFDYTAESDLDRLKRDLDDRAAMFASIKDGVDKYSQQIKDIISSIRKENVELNKNSQASASASLAKFKDAIDKKLAAINKSIADAEKIEIPAPEIEAQKLSLEDTTSFHRVNLVYLVILLASLTITTFALPANFSLGALQFDSTMKNLFVAILFVSLSCFAGLSLMTKVLISQTTDGTIGRAILEKPTVLNACLSAGTIVICFGLIYLIFSSGNLIDSLIPLTLILLSLLGSYVVGRRLVQAIGYWFAMCQSTWWSLKSMLFGSFGFLFIVVKSLASLVVPTLESFAFPIRFLFRKA